MTHSSTFLHNTDFATLLNDLEVPQSIYNELQKLQKYGSES